MKNGIGQSLKNSLHGIRLKFTVFISLLILVVLIVTTAISIYSGLHSLRTELEKRGATVVRNIAVFSIKEVMVMNYSSMRFALDNLKSEAAKSDILYACILSPEGKAMIADRDSEEGFVGKTFDSVVSMKAENEIQIRSVTVTVGGKTIEAIDFTGPIYGYNKLLGYVKVGISTQALDAATQSQIFYGIVMTLIYIVIGFYYRLLPGELHHPAACAT